MPRLVLASASPRRREILAALGIEHEVVVPAVEELTEGEPEAVVRRNALAKARAGLRQAGAGEDDEETWALGVDTEVVLDGRVLGKAASEAEARARLAALSGRSHEVLSGVALLAAGAERVATARSEVAFRELDEGTIALYLASGEWRDRAGAYAIQGLGSILIETVRGDFSNVVGLPVRTILALAPELFGSDGERP